MFLSGECVISLVLSHCSKDFKQRTSNRLSYNSVLLGKQRKVHPQSVRICPPKRRGLSLGSLFLTVLSPPPKTCPMQIGLAKKGVCLFHLNFSLQSVNFPLFLFCVFVCLFVSLPCLLATATLVSFFLF